MKKITNSTFEFANNSAVERLRAQCEAAAFPFQQFHGLSEIARSVSSAAQVARMFESDSVRAIREINRQITVQDNLRDTFTQISSASHAIRELVQNELSRPTHFKNEFLRPQMIDFDMYGDSVRQFQKSLAELREVPEYIANLQRHAFGGVAIQEIVKKPGGHIPL
ncbi:hypothetical protein [Herbaspirillum sp. B65]|uniref:hypothetical protein n=1 Tax=Herbaspirillum sp. B65 TaxID=137708 RepID=UPI0005CB53D4|nr:hypothetical protein [Herbaspirillum sp. B65]